MRAIDTRELFRLPRRPRHDPGKYQARQIAKRWLKAVNADEREALRREIHGIRNRHRAVYVAALATAQIAKVNMELALWFGEFMKL